MNAASPENSVNRSDKPNDKPNIVVILTDDQGPWALGCAGNSEIRTPHLDRLAGQGIRFENFFCASPVCSPARASILTGKIPSAHGVHDWIRFGSMASDDREPGERPIEYLAGQRGYTDILAQNGYTCGLSGKWHLGDSLRPQKGFTHWFAHQFGGGPYYQAPMIHRGRPCNPPGYITQVITDEALEFMEKQAQSEQPFYLSVHYTAPHSPWDQREHPEEVYGSYDACPFASCPELEPAPWFERAITPKTREERRAWLQGYFTAVTAMDSGVGRLLDKLEELGIRRNTLVWFSSDNGMNMGHHGVFGKGNATFPQNMYEESVKVPSIISLPGRVPQGKVEGGLFSHLDFMPTLLDYLGLDRREAFRLPGRSFAALLRGEAAPGHKRVFVIDEYGPVRMIRTREWKYIHRHPYGPHELYNLESDPGERENLFGAEPHRNLIADLRLELAAFMWRYGDPALDGAKEAVTGNGQREMVGPAGLGRPAFY